MAGFPKDFFIVKARTDGVRIRFALLLQMKPLGGSKALPITKASIPENEMALDSEIDSLLKQMCGGDPQTADEVLTLLYDELKGIASRAMRGERANHTLQPTALVNEAFLRLRDLSQIQWRGREHFCAVAAGVMRRVLIDHARKRVANKRGSGEGSYRLDDVPTPWAFDKSIDLLIIDEALDRLAKLNSRHAMIVEMRVFAGLSIAETADVLDVSPTTVKEGWRLSRAWLKVALSDSQETE